EEYDSTPRDYVEAIAGAASQTLQDLLFTAILPVPHVRPQVVREFKDGLKEVVDAPGDGHISSMVLRHSDVVDLAEGAGVETTSDIVQKKKDLFDLADLPPVPT